MTLPVFFFCFLSASPSPSVVVFVKRFLFWSKLVTLFRIISANGCATAQGKNRILHNVRSEKKRTLLRNISLPFPLNSWINMSAEERKQQEDRAFGNLLFRPKSFRSHLNLWHCFVSKFASVFPVLILTFLLLRSKLMWSMVSFSCAVFFSRHRKSSIPFQTLHLNWIERDSVVISILFDWMTFCLCAVLFHFQINFEHLKWQRTEMVTHTHTLRTTTIANERWRQSDTDKLRNVVLSSNLADWRFQFRQQQQQYPWKHDRLKDFILGRKFPTKSVGFAIAR